MNKIKIATDNEDYSLVFEPDRKDTPYVMYSNYGTEKEAEVIANDDLLDAVCCMYIDDWSDRIANVIKALAESTESKTDLEDFANNPDLKLLIRDLLTEW